MAKLLTIDELRVGRNWVGKTASLIRESVIQARGWSRVFPMHMVVKLEKPTIDVGPITYEVPVGIPKIETTNQFPQWVSRIRNYFNEEPRSLRLLSSDEGRFRILTMKDRIPPYVPGAHSLALSGDVYEDDKRRHWFAMSTGGTVYHYPGCVTKTKTALAAATPQALIPIFKLISPDDGTGGSLEVIIFNKQDIVVPLPMGRYFLTGRSTIGPVDVMTNLDGKVQRNAIFQGSYNFSETMIAGILDHEFRDMKPHVEHTEFYLNPDYSKPLEERVFPNIDLSWNKAPESRC